MSDDVAGDLAKALEYARVVAAVLPVDDEAEAMVSRLIARNMPMPNYRILRKRVP